MSRRPLATRPDVAEYLGVPVATLERWAYIGTGPKYRKVGRHTRYAWADVDAWLDSQEPGGTTGSAAAPARSA